MRGYAIVATDYTGLGVDYTTHKYGNFPLHAKDVFFSVIAARKAFGHTLSKHWMASGHSQGGGAVWKLAEDIQSLASDCNQTHEARNYLGTVALAPATRIIDMAITAASQLAVSTDFHDSSAFSLLPLLSIALKRFDSRYNHSILADPMKARIELSDLAQFCASAMLGLTLDLNLTQVGDLNGLSESDAEIAYRFQNQTAPKQGTKTHHPILVVQGINDTAILAETTVSSYHAACQTGSEIHLMLYAKQDHSGVLTTGAVDWLKWIEQRFSGISTSGRCDGIEKKAFDYAYVRAAPEVDSSSGTLN
ncbi:hypothetical protein KCU85_g9381, partial [Aureobasidium melanogenum]